MDWDELPETKKIAGHDLPEELVERSAEEDQIAQAIQEAEKLKAEKQKPLPWLENPDVAPIIARRHAAMVATRAAGLPVPPIAACSICGSRQYWRGKAGGFVCNQCEPPPKPDHESVEEWWCVVPEIGEPW
jgi:hypothetical protein